ncbi:hypothetical protein V6N13_083831 [Hibiscus sabdariffa]|uniref:Uncharacterized protein n=1 Tax=Hibiscus sabdariffa TaxID=183260 RepID=A0ABR2SZ65_9ROSI
MVIVPGPFRWSRYLFCRVGICVSSLAVSQSSTDNQGGNKEPTMATNFARAGKSTLVPIVGPILNQTPGLYLNSENFTIAMNRDREDSPIEHVDGRDGHG